MDEPLKITTGPQSPPLLEALLGIHSAPNVNWLADAAANAAQRGLGALYSILWLTDASGRLAAVAPASGPQKSALARLGQVLDVSVVEMKADPGEKPELNAALAEGRPIEIERLENAFPASLQEEQLQSAERELGVSSAVAAPLHWNGESSGLLLLLFGSGQSGDAADAGLLARHLAVALANIREKDASRKRGEVDAVRWVYDERRFLEELSQEARRAKRHKRPLSVLLVRVLNLQELQTRYGRFLAERVLRQVAGRLDDAMRDTDFLGASGDDGFGAILIEADEDGADVAEERLLVGLGDMDLPHGDLPDLEIRLGWATATLPQDGETPEELTAAAASRLRQRTIRQEDAGSVHDDAASAV